MSALARKHWRLNLNSDFAIFSSDDYHVWRRQVSDCLLADAGAGNLPEERLMQYIWQWQRLNREGLRTVDGRQCEVLHPGFLNRGTGPDFNRALIRLDGEVLLQGDVEIDRRAAGWKAHGHENNPSFERVVLRVVWSPPRKLQSSVPMLALEPFLNDSLVELARGFAADSFALPEEFSGKCRAPLAEIPPEQARRLLRSAAMFRFRQKGERQRLRAREAGWHLALWEGLLAGLGYSRNAWPMRRIGELTPRMFPGFPSASFELWPAAEVEARLFGVAGFLPHDSCSVRQSHVAKLWDAWWRLRDEFSDVAFPEAIWCFSGLRPQNHPHRRLALAACWIRQPGFFQRLEKWFAETNLERPLAPLVNALSGKITPFWADRFHFKRLSSGAGRLALGDSRAIELAMNVILPWFWSRANADGNQAAMQRAERLFSCFPRSGENRLLKDGCSRLLGREDSKTLAAAIDQQGLLQILRDFCSHSNALCENCRFPKLVLSLSTALPSNR